MQSVLLVDPDVDALGSLAARLRARGLDVWIADTLSTGLERARVERPGAILIAAELAAGPDLTELLARMPALAGVPCFRLARDTVTLSPGELLASDVEGIARRVHAIRVRLPAGPEAQEFRGDLGQVPLGDLLQVLGVNRRSGTLSLETAHGSGEIELRDGEIVDALYRRLEGQKALMRLMAQTEGTFSFAAGGASPATRRIQGKTAALLMEGSRQMDEARRLKLELGLGEDALIALSAPDEEMPDLTRHLLEALASPRSLSELLDEVPLPDLEVLADLRDLLERELVERVTGGARRRPLADPERLGVLEALARRAARPGFGGPPRVAIVGSPRRLLGLMAALGRLLEARMPSEAVPVAPVPHVLATLRLGDSVDLEVIGVPLAPAYEPLLGLVLPGSMALAFGESPIPPSLLKACERAQIPTYDASSELGPGPDVDAEQAANVICQLLEHAVQE